MSKPGPLFCYGPEDKVLLPALPGVLLGDPFPLADPPPPLGLVVADSEGLCPWLVLGMDVAAARVIPSVTAGVNSPLDYVTPVSGGTAHTQLISGSTLVCSFRNIILYKISYRDCVGHWAVVCLEGELVCPALPTRGVSAHCDVVLGAVVRPGHQAE